jgi:hypothetical protein
MAEVITPWKITSTWGQTVSLQSEGIKVAISAATFHLKLSNETTKARVQLDAKGVGGGVGVQVSPPFISVDGSLEAMPSGGIGHLYDLRGPLFSKPLTTDDLAGFAVVLTGTCKGMAGGSISTIVFSRGPPLGGVIIPKAIGFFSGMAAGTTLGLGLDGVVYYVHSVTDLDAPPTVYEIPQVRPDERPPTAVPVGGDVYLSPSPERDVFGR